MSKQKWLSIVLLTLMVGQVFLLTGIATNLNNQTSKSNTNNLSNVNDNNTTPNSVIPPSSAGQVANTWWNDSYTQRILINVTEPNVSPRTNEAVSVNLNFANGTNYENTTQVVQYSSSGTWIRIQSQISNDLTWSNPNYTKSYTITFLVTIGQNQINHYYVYYSNKPLLLMSLSSQLQTTITADNVSINNGHYQAELGVSSGYNNLTYNGLNYHTDSSMSPLSMTAPSTGSTYSTDSNGYIRNWLIVGPFSENPARQLPNYQEASEHYFVNIQQDYVQGDYATGGNATRNLNTNLQWTAYQSSTNLINYYNIYRSGQTNYCSAYSLVYVYTPVTLSNIFCKVGSDDGIGVIMDHSNSPLLIYSDVARAIGTDQSVSNAFTMTAGWHSFMVFTTEVGGQWSFDMRFSPNNIPGSSNVITNLTLSLVPHTSIQSISPVATGPVYSTLQVQWTKSENMSTTDYVTYYAGSSMYKIDRTFYWSYPQQVTSFAALNTYYPSTYFDEYLYDGQSVLGLSNTQFTAQNYTVIRDSTGDNYLTTLGVFISNITEGGYDTVNSLYWKTAYTSGSPGIVDMMPGGQTSINANSGNYDNNITITFWEYIDSNIGSVTQDSGALGVVNGIYNSLKNPLQVTNGSAQNLFFNLNVNCKDHDGQNAQNVTISVYNATSKAFITSQNTTSSGLASFSGLQGGNYSVNATYINFGQTLILNSTIVNLTESETITLNNLNLTTLALTLQSFGTTNPESIIGATVSFYSNSSGTTTFIGNETSDSSGFVPFYWTSENPNSMNYTFYVSFLGSPRYILPSDGTGNYTYSITTSLESYTTMTVNVSVENFQTTLFVNSGNIMPNITWGDHLSIITSYFYQYGANLTNATYYPIDQASVTYTLQSLYGTLATGVLNSNATLGDGYYTVTLDTKALGMNAQTPYSLYISASKPGYTPAVNFTSINLNPVTTQLSSPKNSLSVYWNQNITLDVQFNDTYNHQLISDGSLSYSVAQLPAIQGQLVRDVAAGSGWYNMTLNTTAFGFSGSYSLTITATKNNYATSSITIPVTILKIQTLLNGTIFLQQSLKMYVTTTHNFYFNYSLPNGKGISNASTTTWELQDLDQNYTGQSLITGTLNETSTPGMYEIVGFNTTNLAVGDYSLVVTISQTNYVERVCAYSITVSKIPMVLQNDITGNIYQEPKGQNITISLVLMDSVYNKPITGANVQITFNNQTYTMVESGTTGNYSFTIDTSGYKVLANPDTFPAVISITYNNNYTISNIRVQIQVQPPLGPFGIPLIYWIIIGSVIVAAIAVYSISRGVAYARIPMMIKLIKSTEKSIKKKSRFSSIKITRSPEEMIEEDSENEYAILGLSLKGKLSGRGKEAPGTNTDLDEIDRRAK